jgi:elongator complex protein 3
MPNTKLYNLWKNGEYKPYSLQETVKLITEIKKQVPKWVRIQRIQRDIPINLIAEGVKRGDLRILVQKQLKKDGGKCNCIRCREVGHVQYKTSYDPNPKDVKLVIDKYPASKGEEIFLSFEDTKSDVLIGLLRLRHPTKTKSMLIRELHVFGPTVMVGANAQDNQWQHKGWGERLMQEAERISQEEYDAYKISVLSGIGTRNYYRRFGYEREGPYMVKKFKK